MTTRSLCLGVMAVWLVVTLGLLVSSQRVERFEEDKAGRVAEGTEERNLATRDLSEFVVAQGRNELDPVWVPAKDLLWLHGSWTSAANPADGYIHNLDVPGRGDGPYQLSLSDDGFRYQFGSPYAGAIGLPGAHWSAGFAEGSNRFQLSFASGRWFECDVEADRVMLVTNDEALLPLTRVRTEPIDGEAR